MAARRPHGAKFDRIARELGPMRFITRVPEKIALVVLVGAASVMTVLGQLPIPVPGQNPGPSGAPAAAPVGRGGRGGRGAQPAAPVKQVAAPIPTATEVTGPGEFYETFMDDYDDAKKAAHIQPVLDNQIHGQKRGDQGAADIDGDDGSRPLIHCGDNVLDPVGSHYLVRNHFLRSQLRHGNVYVASQQRQQEYHKDITATDPHALVGVLEDVKFEQRDRHEEERPERKEKWPRNRKEVQAGRPHECYPRLLSGQERTVDCLR